MYIFLSILFMNICWICGILFFIMGGISQPQYGSKKFKIKYHIFFIVGLLLLFLVLPFTGFYFAL